MPISLILTPFDHFHFRPALAVKCIHDLRICLMAMLMVVMNHYHHLHDPPSLCLPYVADDSLLCKLGSGVCPSLKHLDVQVASLTLIPVVMTMNMILTVAMMIIINANHDHDRYDDHDAHHIDLSRAAGR